MQHLRNDSTRKIRITWRKTFPSATCPRQVSHTKKRGSNLGLDKPATKALNPGTVPSSLVCKLSHFKITRIKADHRNLLCHKLHRPHTDTASIACSILGCWNLLQSSKTDRQDGDLKSNVRIPPPLALTLNI